MPRLRRADCSKPGIRRRRHGRGFVYVDETSGERVTDDEVLRRIDELVIPPAWRDVWICPHHNGHLQAVGTDAAGRRQYRYHDQWRARRDSEKFERMERFARCLPGLREHCAEVLAGTDEATELTRTRVLACALRLLDQGFFRIGTEAYTEANDTFGLATMRREHVRIEGYAVEFDYPAKGRQRRVQSIADRAVIEVIAKLGRRRSGPPDLLVYKEGGRWRDLSSRDVNEELKVVCGEEFSAKDFRTWNATVLAAVALAVSGPARSSESARKRAKARAVSEVAHYLGNTPSVARGSYIDPRVFDRFDAGRTIADALDALGEDAVIGQPSIQGEVEEAVLDLLDA